MTNLTLYLLWWFLLTLNLALGYYWGRGELNVQEKIHAVKKVISPTKVGAINTITAAQQFEDRNPKLKEGNQAMRETLSKLFGRK